MAKWKVKRRNNAARRPEHVNGHASNQPTIDAEPIAATPSEGGTNEQSAEPEPSTINGFDAIDPETAGSGSGGSSGDATGRRKYKHSPSYYKSHHKQAPAPKNNLIGIEGMLITIHFAASKFLDSPEMMLGDEEAASLAQAGANVAKHYDQVLSPKGAAWLNLAGVAGAIYGTRLYAIYARKKQEAAAAKESRPANLVDIKVTKGGPVPAPGQAQGGDARTPADLFGMNYSAAIVAEI